MFSFTKELLQNSPFKISIMLYLLSNDQLANRLQLTGSGCRIYMIENKQRAW